MQAIAYDPWTDRKHTDGIWKCHYPFVVGARKHTGGDAWVVLRAMGTVTAVIWFCQNSYAGTVDQAVAICNGKDAAESLAKAKAYGDRLLADPIPEQVVEARKEYLALKARAGKAGGEKKQQNKVAAATVTPTAAAPTPVPKTAAAVDPKKTFEYLDAEKRAEWGMIPTEEAAELLIRLNTKPK